MLGNGLTVGRLLNSMDRTAKRVRKDLSNTRWTQYELRKFHGNRSGKASKGRFEIALVLRKVKKRSVRAPFASSKAALRIFY